MNAPTLKTTGTNGTNMLGTLPITDESAIDLRAENTALREELAATRGDHARLVGLLEEACAPALDALVFEWAAAAKAAARLRSAADVGEASVLLASQQKTETARKAEAEIASAAERLSAALAEIDERALYHRVIGARGPDWVREGGR